MPYFATGSGDAGQTHGIPKTGDPNDGGYGFPLEGDRFTDNGDGTVTDNATGLMWTKNPWDINHHEYAFRQFLDFDPAVSECASLLFAGFDDWHLPTIYQLCTMATRPGDVGVDTVFQNIKIGEINEGWGPPIYGYWSSTTHPYINYGYLMDFSSGQMDSENKQPSQGWLYHCLAWPMREAYGG